MEVKSAYMAARQQLASPLPQTHPDTLAMALEECGHAYHMNVHDLPRVPKDLMCPFRRHSAAGQRLISCPVAWINAAHRSRTT